ncbi:MAG: hypothetical protein ABR549_11965, partial [Mycobacteriales bacterium]
SPAKSTYGKVVAIAGRLTDEAGNGIVSASVAVQARYAGGQLTKPITVLTDEAGRFTTFQAPKHNARFVGTYAGTTTAPIHDPVTVTAGKVLVRPLVKITSPKKTASMTQVVKGKVAPNKRGAIVRLYVLSKHGNSLVGKDSLNKRSRFAIKATLPKGKKVHLLATIGKTAGNIKGKSAILTLTVS